VRWHRLVRRAFRVMPVPDDGMMRSTVFPRLWLNVPVLLAKDMAQVVATLQQGLQSLEHDAFVNRLARKKKH
jgi:hypothetical protein